MWHLLLVTQRRDFRYGYRIAGPSDPDGKGLDSHWQKTAFALLVGVILHALYKAKDDGGTADGQPFDRSDLTAARVPAVVSIAPGQTNASFGVAAVDDAFLDGTQTAVEYLSPYVEQALREGGELAVDRAEQPLDLAAGTVPAPPLRAPPRPLVHCLLRSRTPLEESPSVGVGVSGRPRAPLVKTSLD